jgi:acyl carrier protein
MPTRPPTSRAIEAWLVARIGQLLTIEPAAIDPNQPFAEYGLGSLQALELSGALEEWLGLRLPATLAWEYPTVRLLSAHLAEQIGSSR